MQEDKKKLISTLNFNFSKCWIALSKIGSCDYPFDKPLTYKILEDHKHPVTKRLIYIHSMETFLYKELKRASLQKDETRIPSLGPYSAALSFIISSANKSRLKASKLLKQNYKNIKVYRGMYITKELFQAQFLPTSIE